MTSISCGAPNSYLGTLGRKGLIFKSGRNLIDLDHSLLEAADFSDVVFCKNCYFLAHPSSNAIFKFSVDSLEFQRSLENITFNKVNFYTKNLRASADQRSLIVNSSDTALFVIEVEHLDLLEEFPGEPRILIISNRTGSRVSCHEPIFDDKLLTINKEGLFVVYQVDFLSFLNYEELEVFQVDLKDSAQEDYFYMSICERSELCALLICSKRLNFTASRILVFRLNNKEGGEDILTLSSQIDLRSQFLGHYYSICFSRYFGKKIFICGYSMSGGGFGYSFHLKNDGKIFQCFKGSGLYSVRNRCSKLVRNGEEVWGMLWSGSVIKFSFTNTPIFDGPKLRLHYI